MSNFQCYYPYCNNNSNNRMYPALIPFIGGVLIGGLGTYVMSKNNHHPQQSYQSYAYYPYTNQMPYYSYPTYNTGQYLYPYYNGYYHY